MSQVSCCLGLAKDLGSGLPVPCGKEPPWVPSPFGYSRPPQSMHKWTSRLCRGLCWLCQPHFGASQGKLPWFSFRHPLWQWETECTCLQWFALADRFNLKCQVWRADMDSHQMQQLRCPVPVPIAEKCWEQFLGGYFSRVCTKWELPHGSHGPHVRDFLSLRTVAGCWTARIFCDVWLCVNEDCLGLCKEPPLLNLLGTIFWPFGETFEALELKSCHLNAATCKAYGLHWGNFGKTSWGWR